MKEINPLVMCAIRLQHIIINITFRISKQVELRDGPRRVRPSALHVS